MGPLEYLADPWWHRAKLIRVVDGDTYYMQLDGGFHVYCDQSIRLWGVNCPELSTAEGKAARDWVTAWLQEHLHGAAQTEWTFIAETEKDKQTFARYVAHIWCLQGHSLGDAILAAGQGVVMAG